MRIGDVLRRVPGLTKQFLYYLESKAYITPGHIRKQRLSRRDYSEEDLLVIRQIFELYQQGFSPRGAAEHAKDSVTDSHLHIFSLRLSSPFGELEQTFAHAGETEDKFIKIIPETRFLVVAKQVDENDGFVLRVSVHVDSQSGPLLIRFRKGNNVVRQLTTDSRGSASQEGLSREDIEALRGCRVDVLKETASLTLEGEDKDISPGSDLPDKFQGFGEQSDGQQDQE